LTIDEKQNADLQREIYVLIRLIDVIEKCAQLSDDRITPDEHFKQMSKLLEKLESFQKKLPGFKLNTFIEVRIWDNWVERLSRSTVWMTASSESIELIKVHQK
jgi:hypothetical protein